MPSPYDSGGLDPATLAQLIQTLPTLGTISKLASLQRNPNEIQNYMNPFQAQMEQAQAIAARPSYAPSGMGNQIHFMGGSPFPVQSSPQYATAIAALVSNLMESARLVAEARKRKGGTSAAG